MQITPLQSVAPVAPPAGHEPARGDDGFAALLSRQAGAAPENTASDAAGADAEGDTDTNADSAAPAATTARDGGNVRARAAARPATPARPAAKATPAEAARSESTDPAEAPADADTAATTATIDPAMAHWLAGLHLPPAERTEAGAAGTAVDPQALAGRQASAAGTAGTAATADGEAGRLQPRGAERDDGRSAVDARPARTPSDFGRALAAAGRDEDTRPAAKELAAAAPATPRSAGPDGAAAALAAAPAPAAAAPNAAAPLDVMLPLAPDSPDFAQALGVQVSVLARDGVQHAELHLNPAETGPLSVQIVLEGTQARIDFGADAAPTRQAIEQSLPELAAALRDAGLTLSGGGVSEHPRGREPAAPAEGPRERARPAAVGGTESAPRPWRASRSAGGVDLYA